MKGTMTRSVQVVVLAAIQFLRGAALSIHPRQQPRHNQLSAAPWRRLTVVMNDGNAKRAIQGESPPSVIALPDLSQADTSGAPIKSQLLHYQEKAAPVATSFKPTQYRPVPLLTNCHLQTIGGVFFRDLTDCAYVTDVASTIKSVVERALNRKEDDVWFWDERQRIDTPDGDFFHVDYKYTNADCSEGTIVLLHGLQSNSNSSLSVDLANAYHHQLGMDVVCINFRGCSGVPNDKIGESLEQSDGSFYRAC